MNQKGLAPILIVLILAGIITFAPLPRYQQAMCNEIYPPICYPAGWKFGSSLWNELTGKTTQTVQKSIPSPLPTPTGETVYTELDRSANWKTYTNNRWKFSFKYPSDSELFLDTDTEDNIQIWIESLNGGHTIYITAISNTNKLSLNNPKELFNKGPFTADLGNAEIKEILLGGHRAFRADNCCLDNIYNFWAETEIITIKDDVIYELRAEAEPSSEKRKRLSGKDKAILDTIFSTFQFLP